MGGEMELGKNRKEVTERVSTNWKDNGQKEKKKRERAAGAILTGVKLGMEEKRK
jgi:hypothetical protein